MKIFKNLSGWAAVAALFILGIFIHFCVMGCSFLGLVVCGIAAILSCYLLLGILKKHRKKAAAALTWALTALLCLGLIAAVITGVLIGNAAGGEDTTGCQYVIVLGAGVNGTVPSKSLQERIDAAYTYLTEHPQVICVVSGGQGPGEDITEAQCMYGRLTALGIDPERIWLEESSTSTRENIAFSLDLIEARTGVRPTSAGILSSEYHLFRAKAVAAEQGLTAVGIPARTGWAHLFINYFLREIVAVWFYALAG